MWKVIIVVLVYLLIGCSNQPIRTGFSTEDKYKAYAITAIQCFQKGGYTLQNYIEFLGFLKGDGSYDSMALVLKNSNNLKKVVAVNRTMLVDQYGGEGKYYFQFADDRFFIKPWMDDCEYFREEWTDPLLTKPTF